MNFINGTIGYIKFGNTLNGEINNIHLAVLYNIPNVDNVIFVVPLTSPKLKHFTSEENYIKRNYKETKFLRLHYLKQTDSIALLEQIKIVSKSRLINFYKDEDHKDVILNDKELAILNNKIIKYMKYILYKKV